MNEWELFEALSDIEPSMILDSCRPKPRRPIWRMLLLAAVIIMLVGTVAAVGLRAQVRHLEKTVELQGVSFQKDGEETELSYYTVQVRFEMRQAKLTAMQDLKNDLTQQWQKDPTIKYADLRLSDGGRRNLGSVAEAEAFFGLELLNATELESMVRGTYVTMVISDTERAKKEFESSGAVSPDGLIVYLSLRREASLDARLVSECGISVFIPLTEAFLQQEEEQCLYSYEKEGRFAESGMLTVGGKSILLLENAPKQGFRQTGYAAWCANGFGYLAHIKTYPDSYATPLCLLTPILNGLY